MKRTETAMQPENNPGVLDEFGTRLQNLFDQTFADKSKELTERERIVSEREAKVDRVLANTSFKGNIRLQVGQITYYTRVETLQKAPYSFFTGLLNPDLNIDLKEPIFIDRDGEVFKYVLEYLTYGKLVSQIENDGVIQKLLLDADYYLLPGLEEQLKAITLVPVKKGCNFP